MSNVDLIKRLQDANLDDDMVLRHEAADALAAQEWQTIDTAPKDGTEIDLWAFDREHCCWSRRPDCYWSAMMKNLNEESEGWAGLWEMHCDFQPPTHWRPLPPPPESTS